MEFSKEQLIKVKEQLIEQVQTTFPEEKKAETIKQLEEMDDEQLIAFLKQNNLIKESENSNQQCIFCSLIFGDLPSTKIAENDKAIAILELNPISEGHTLILPKDHISDPTQIPEEAKELAKELAKKIQNTFNPTKIDLVNSETMGHQAINILPIYNNETINSERHQKTPEQLAELKKKIEDQPEQIEETKPEEIKEEKPEEKINESSTWLPRRIP